MCIQKETAGLCAVTYTVLFSVDEGGRVLTVHEWARYTCHFQVECVYFRVEKDFIHQKPTFPKPTSLPPSLSPSLSGENNPITFVSLDQVPGIVCLYTLSHTHTHTPLWVPVPMALSSSICSSWAWTPHLRKHSSVGRAPCSLFPVSRLDLREARNIWKASSESEV